MLSSFYKPCKYCFPSHLRSKKCLTQRIAVLQPSFLSTFLASSISLRPQRTKRGRQRYCKLRDDIKYTFTFTITTLQNNHSTYLHGDHKTTYLQSETKREDIRSGGRREEPQAQRQGTQMQWPDRTRGSAIYVTLGLTHQVPSFKRSPYNPSFDAQ